MLDYCAMNKPEYIIIHHSATADGTLSDWEAIRKYHMQVKGFQDVAYNWGIDRIQGKPIIQRGRPEAEVGAHALGFNAQSVGICIVGTYDVMPLEDDKRELLYWLIRDIRGRYSIPTAHIIGHRETYPLRGVPVEKSCPGKLVDLAKIRIDLA